MRNDLFERIQLCKGDFENWIINFFEMATNIKNQIWQSTMKQEKQKGLCSSRYKWKCGSAEFLMNTQVTLQTLCSIRHLNIFRNTGWLQSDCFSHLVCHYEISSRTVMMLFMDLFFFSKISKLKIEEFNDGNGKATPTKQRESLLYLLIPRNIQLY